jgi:RHS repeat-associated protein
VRRRHRVRNVLIVLWMIGAAREASAQQMVSEQGAALTPQSVTTWTTGSYLYDGAGNVTAIGNDTYVYDQAGRLVRATAGPGHEQRYAYDAFGNLTAITTDGDTATALRLGANPATNRMDLRLDAFLQPYNAYGDYDAAGNMTSYLDVDRFAYDGLSMMTESTVSGARRLYLYSPTDERLGVVSVTGNTPVDYRWTLRDDEGKVLREVEKAIGSGGSASWMWNEDYIYRDATMLAAEINGPERTLHFFVDHLGTPRLITGNGGAKVALHTYYAFGRELTEPFQDLEKKKFTGHERDFASLDYMHARYYAPFTGRFLSVDPTLDFKRAVQSPQGWNRYAYVENNPILVTDPDGRELGLDVDMYKRKVDPNSPVEKAIRRVAIGGLIVVGAMVGVSEAGAITALTVAAARVVGTEALAFVLGNALVLRNIAQGLMLPPGASPEMAGQTTAVGRMKDIDVAVAGNPRIFRLNIPWADWNSMSMARKVFEVTKFATMAGVRNDVIIKVSETSGGWTKLEIFVLETVKTVTKGPVAVKLLPEQVKPQGQ